MNTATHLTEEPTMEKCRDHKCQKDAVNEVTHGFITLTLCATHTKKFALVVLDNAFQITITPLPHHRLISD